MFEFFGSINEMYILLKELKMKKVLYLMMVLAVCGTAHATVLLYDGFDYPAGENLHDQEGWDILLFGNAITPVITAAETRSGHGNSITSTGVDATYCIRQHLIPQAIDTSVDIVYLSALMRQDADTYHDAQGMLLGIGNGENGAAKKVEARFNPHSEKITIYDRGYFEPTGMVFEKNRTYQLVFKLSPVVDEPNLIMMDAGYFDVTDGPVADESEIVYQVSQHVSGTSDAALLLPFGHVYIGFRGDVIVGDDFIVTDDWADIQAIVVAPLAHWTLDAADIVAVDPNDPNSEVLAVDVTGNGFDGVIEGGIAWIEDPEFGTVLEFDGVDDRIVIPDANFIEFTQPCSVAFWVKTDAVDVNNVVLSKANGNDVWDQAEKMVEITNSTTWAHTAQGVPVGAIEFEGSWCSGVGGTTDVSDGVWHHVAVTWNGAADSGAMYIDGVPETLSLNGYNGNYADNEGDVLNIGWHDSKGSFTGSIADVRLYDVALTADEVAAIVRAATVALIADFDNDGTGEDWLTSFNSGGRFTGRSLSTDTPDGSANSMQIDIDYTAGGWGSAWGAFTATGIGWDPNNFDASGYNYFSAYMKSSIDGAKLDVWFEHFPGPTQGYVNQVTITDITTDWAYYEVDLSTALPIRDGLHDMTAVNRMSFGGPADLGAPYTILLDQLHFLKIPGGGMLPPEPPEPWVDPDPNEVTLMIAPIGTLLLDDPNDDDPNTPILITSINGTSTDALVQGTTTANPDNQERADNFDVSQDSDYARRDSENFVTTMFDVPVSVIYIVEKDGQDSGYVEVLNAEGGTISDRVDFTGDNFSKTPSSQWLIGGMMVIADIPVNGIRIWSTGIDVQSISAIPAP